MTKVLPNAQLALITLITVAFLWATMPGPARGEDLQVPLCYSQALPGSQNTLNPNAPKERRVQERVKVCDYILTTDGHHHHPRIDPIEPVMAPPAPVHIA